MARTFFKNEDPDDTGIAKVNDDSPMPFGKHERTRMDKVSPSYLIWMHDNLVEREAAGQKLRDDEKAVLDYTNDRLEALELEAEDENGED